MSTYLFGDDPSKRRREINLGGTRVAVTNSDILQEAKARRENRLEGKRREEGATRIQAWWRRLLEARRVAREVRMVIKEDPLSLRALRALMLIGPRDGPLTYWAQEVLKARSDPDPYAQKDILANDDPSSVFLLSKVAFNILRSVAQTGAQSETAIPKLTIVQLLLSSVPHARDYCLDFVKRGSYDYIGAIMTRIPMEDKSAPAWPLLVNIINLPLSHPHLQRDSLRHLLLWVLTIPLLPNRLPLQCLTELSAQLPLSAFAQYWNDKPVLMVTHRSVSTPEAKVHMLANLAAFMPPRYTKLPIPAVNGYLRFCAAMMTALPPNALEPPETPDSSVGTWADGDGDDDMDVDREPRVAVVSAFSSPLPPLPVLDSRTRKRLQILPSTQHLHSLMSVIQKTGSRIGLMSYLYALVTVWPSRRDRVLSAVFAWNNGGLVREIFRGYVRSCALFREESTAQLFTTTYSDQWPPLLFLVELYTQALLTMGDDEFFSSANPPAAGANGETVVFGNPLTLDEIRLLTRRLLTTAFSLYWHNDQAAIQEGGVPGLNLKWVQVRDKITKYLQAIHARDSRRQFISSRDWLGTSEVNLATFVQAAVFEERQLAESSGARPLSKRQIAYLSPRLGVLNNIPFSIPFGTRFHIFRNFAANDMRTRGRAAVLRRPTRITIRRDHVAEDGFDHLASADLKEPIAITFIDQFGQEEAGIDGGGVFKEFLTSLCKEVFDTDRGLWLANTKQELYPNPHSYATESHSLSWYRFIGRILGKALYEGILVDVAFAGFFLAKWLGRQSFLDDLASLDPELYRGLLYLKHYAGNPEDLTLNFTVTEEEFGVAHATDLVPGGGNIPVTRENRLQYIYLVAHYKLTKQIKRQSEAFFEGLSTMIDRKWLRMFNQQELQVLLAGIDSAIDLDDLRKHTNYGGLFDDHAPTIETFWRVVNGFDQDQRRKLLRFATSCSRPPLLGFRELVPNFAIRDAGSDESRLPTASTCVNLLKLPRYTDENVLREKLLQAINANAGFDLS